MKFRKKPVVIEAVHLTRGEQSIAEVLRFIGQKVDLKSSIDQDKFTDYCYIVEREGLQIHTLEGVMTANINDWIIKGVNGEFYPCKPDIFDKTYDVVNGYDIVINLNEIK